MAVPFRRAQSAFQLSLRLALGLALLLVVAQTLAARFAPVTAAFSQIPNTNELARKGLTASRRARFGTNDTQDTVYAEALRQACALPRHEMQWKALGPTRTAPPANICQRQAHEYAARLNGTADPQLNFLNGALQSGASIWWASAGPQGLWRGTTAGWQNVNRAPLDFIAHSPLEPQTLYALRDGWQLERSADGGASFATLTNQLAEADDDARLPVAPLALHPTQPDELWTGGRALWRLIDGGAQWTRASGPVAGTVDNRVSALAVGESHFVLAGTSEGWLQRFSFGTGADQLLANDAALPRRGYVSALALSPQDERVIYAAYTTFGGAHVWQSADGGLTWHALDGTGAAALPDVPVTALAVDPNVNGRLFAGTDVGVFVTDTLAPEPTWSLVWPGAWVTSLQITEDGQQLYAFANERTGAGVWRTSLTELNRKTNQPAQQCSIYSISPVALIAPAEGQTSTIEVLAPDQCEWQAVPLSNAADWVTVASPAGGKGNGRVTLNIAVNAPFATRFGTVNIGGQTLEIGQQGSANNCRVQPIRPGEIVNGQLSAEDCLVSFGGAGFYFADRYSFTARAGELLAVRAQGPTEYTQFNYALTGPDGKPLDVYQNGRLNTLPLAGAYTLQISSAQQKDTLNYRLSIQLLSAGCDSFGVTALDSRFPAAGGTGRLSISTATNCAWQVLSSNTNWLVPATTSSSGSKLLTFNVAENNSPTVRTAYLDIAGQQAVITQAGRGGECGPRPIEPFQTINDSLSAADCPVRTANNNFGPMRQYTFSGRAGQRLSVELGLPTQMFTLVYLFNPRGDLLTQGDRRLPQFAPDVFTLPADGPYTVGVATNNLPLNFSLTLQLYPSECVYTVTPERLVLPASGGTATVQLQTESLCPWRLTPQFESDWLPLPPQTSGTGSHTLTLNVPANSLAYRRFSNFYLGGQQVQILQAGRSGTCATRPIAPGGAVTGTIDQGDCPPLLLPGPGNYDSQQLLGDRFSFSGTAGQVFSFTVALPTLTLPGNPVTAGYALADPQGQLIMAGRTDPAQPSPSLVLPASGTYMFELTNIVPSEVFGYSLTIQLGAVGCTTNAMASQTRFETAGGDGILQIDAPPGCRWQVQPLTAPRQFRLDVANEGTGRGEVRFSFGPNSSSTAATAILRVGEQTIYLAQAGVGGACRPLPLPFEQFINGQIASSDCPLAASWTAAFFSNTQRGKRYTFAGQAGEQIALTALRRIDEDTPLLTRPTLKLFDPDGQLLTDGVTARALGGQYLLAKTGAYTLEVAPGSDYPYFAAYQLLLERLTAGCLYTSGLRFQRFDGLGGNGTFNLSTGAQCRWTPRSNALWLRPVNPPGDAPLMGSAAGSFTVEANASPQARLASIVAGGQVVEIEQAGSGGQCAIASLTPNRQINAALTASDCRPRVGNDAMADIYQLTTRVNERFRFVVNSTPVGFPMSFALLDSDWRIVTQWGTSNPPATTFALPPGTYYLQVTTNQSITNLPYTLMAELVGGQCNYTILPSDTRFFMAGGTGTLSVLAAEGCVWTATALSNYPPPNWLTITSGASGSGSGTITFQVQPFEVQNNVRSSWIDVAGQRFTFTQTSSRPPTDCEVTGLTVGQAVSGTLTPNDCAGLFTTVSDTRGDRFSFIAPANQQFAIEVNSNTALYLTLYDAAQRVVAQTFGTRLPANAANYLVLPGGQTYFFEIAYASPTQTLGYRVQLATPTACAFTLQQTTPAQNQPLPAAGGNGVLQVITAPGCVWQARGADGDFPPWLTLTGATSGTGPGTLTFSVAPNDSDNFRTGYVTAGSTTLPAFQIVQLGRGGQCGTRAITAGETVRGTLRLGDCPNTLRPPNGINYSPPTHSFTFNAARGEQLVVQARRPANVGAGQFALFDPRGQTVAWNGGVPVYNPNVYPVPMRLTLLASGTYTLELTGNAGDYEFVLDLTAAACGFTLDSEQAQVSGAGGSGTINVLTQSSCSWVASSTDPWITVTRGSGQGNGTLSFTAAPNTETTETRTRVGSIQVAGRGIPVVQAGYGGSCAPVPISAGQTIAGEITQRDCLRLGTTQQGGYQMSAQLVDRYSFTARAGEHAQVKVVSNGALGVQIVPVSTLQLSSAPPLNFQPGQPVDWFGTASLTIPADGAYIIEVMPNIYSPYLGAYTLHLEVNAPGCGVALSQNERQFANAAATGSFAVASAPACRWQVYAVNDWLTVNGARERSGAGEVSYSLSANTGAQARWGALIAGGQIFIVEQAGAGNGVPGTCVSGALAAGQTVFGNLSRADCRPFAPNDGLTVADRYTFNGQAGQRIQIVARTSSVYLPALRLFDSQTNLLASVLGGTNLQSPPHTRLPATSDFFTLPASGAYFVEIAPYDYNGAPVAQDYSLSLVVTAPACAFNVAAQPLRFEAAGGAGTISVLTDSACAWTPTFTDAWINSSAASQIGNGTVTFTVPPNTESASRRSLLLVGGRVCVIEQAGVNGTCSVSPIQPGQRVTGALDERDCHGVPLPRADQPNALLPVYAERFSFTGQANDRVVISTTVEYAVASSQNAVTLRLIGPNGVQVYVSFTGRLPDYNDRAVLPASGTYEIELSSNQKLNYTLTLLREAPACQLNVTPRQFQFEAAGGNGALTVTAPSSCAWQAVSNAPWLTLANTPNRTGDGTLNFTVAPNTNAQARTAKLTLGGDTINIEQAGNGGSCPPRLLARNQIIRGRWDDSDCGGRILPPAGVCCPTYYEDRYTFNAAAGEGVSFTLQTSAVQPRIELYDAQMQLRYAVNGTRLPSGAGEFILPAAGGYTVIVRSIEALGYELLAASSNACTVTAAPNPLLAPGSGGKASLTVTTSQPGCAWAVRSATSWLQLPGGGAQTQFFSGAQTLELTLAPNLGETRSGFLWLADSLITLQQGVRQLVNSNDPLLSVNAATFAPGPLAPESIVSAFGTRLALETRAAAYWQFLLGDTAVTITDRLQVERPAYVLFVSPTQVNFVMPAGLATGPATVAITSGDGLVTHGTVNIAPVAPGLFAANASGSGLASGFVLRSGNQYGPNYEPLAQFDRTLNRFVAVPVTVDAPGETVALVLFGTGLRARDSLASVSARIGTTPLLVSYCGAVQSLLGLDQINLTLPATLAGSGNVQVEITVDGKAANPLRFTVK